MRRDVTAALRLALQGHLSLRKSRLESFCVLVVGVLLSRTVNLSHLACMFPTRAAIASNYRRLQRFFEQVILDGSQLARVIVRIVGVGSGPWLLALDRTCWKFGRYDINILMLAIIHNGIAIPVMWDVLGRAGNSTTAQRSALLSRFCAVFGETAIAGLIADREFIGTAWMTSLAERDIPFILRIKDTFHVRLCGPTSVPSEILVSEGRCGRTTLHPRELPAWITRQLAWTAAETGCDAVGQRRPACSRHQHRSQDRLGPLPAAVGDRNALRGHQDARLQFRGYPPHSPRPDRQASRCVGRSLCVRPRDR